MWLEHPRYIPIRDALIDSLRSPNYRLAWSGCYFSEAARIVLTETLSAIISANAICTEPVHLADRTRFLRTTTIVIPNEPLSDREVEVT